MIIKWFWHIPDPSQYWYQGNGTVRNIDSNTWGVQKLSTEDNLGRTFEWHFSAEDWVFFEGEKQDQRKIFMHFLNCEIWRIM